MRKTTLLLICLTSFVMVQAQESAVTEKGEQVILFSDGTWKYENEDLLETTIIPLNSKKFYKDSNSTFLLKSNKFNIGFWLNPKKWSFKKAIDNPDAEYELELKNEDLYGMIITEKAYIPVETLRSIAIDNAKAMSTDINIVKEEYRIVNGIKVLLLHLNGTMQGINFFYYGYYYSNSNGTVQFITFTTQNLISSYKPACENLLNGIIELE